MDSLNESDFSAKKISKTVVFSGPSLSRQDCDFAGSWSWLGPATRGDFCDLYKQGVTTVILIDGFMVYAPSPSPKEIAGYIDQGGTVYGSASLGALRAVELREIGVIGSGWVYEQYLTNKLMDDDHLLCVLHPETFQALTIPYVNLLYGLSSISESYRHQGEINQFLEEAKLMHFEDRTQHSLESLARDSRLPASLIAESLEPKYNIKLKDALECCALVAQSEQS